MVAVVCLAAGAGCNDEASGRQPDGAPDGGHPDAAREGGVADGTPSGTPDGGLPCFLEASGPELRLCGEPLRGIGVNKFDLFHQFVGSASGGAGVAVTRPMAIEALDDAAAAGLRVLRVAAVGFWPTDGTTTLWREAPDEYWAAMDDMLAEVRARDLYVVPVAWWNLALFADLAGEPFHAMFEPGSSARAMLFDYAETLAGRYRDAPEVLFWELTNEGNLGAELDFGLRTTAGVCVPCGTPESRSAADNFTSDEMAALLGDLGAAIHAADPNHLVSSGHSAPRPAAMHLRAQPEWSAAGPDWTVDTAAEMQEFVALMHPDPIDIVSIHFYESPEGRFGVPGDPSADLLESFVQASDLIDKPLLVGEFGEVVLPIEVAPEGNYTRGTVLKAFDLRVPLSLIWVWEFYQSSPDVPAGGSIEPRMNDALIAVLTEVSGWLASASSTRAQALGVPNGGFEEDGDGDGLPDGWSASAPADASLDSAVAFLGAASLRLETGSGDPAAAAWVFSDPIEVQGGEDVVLSAALRRDLPPGAAAAFSLHQFAEDGTWLGQDVRTLGVGGDDRFLLEYFRTTLETEARSAQVFIWVGPGEDVTVHVDEIRISWVEP